MDYLFVYVTMPFVDVAKNIVRQVIEDHLAACANILGEVLSCYHWNGKINEDQEVACLFKTTKAAYPALEKRIKTLHPYETPCIVGFPVECGEAGFLQWIQSSIEKQY